MTEAVLVGLLAVLALFVPGLVTAWRLRKRRGKENYRMSDDSSLNTPEAIRIAQQQIAPPSSFDVLVEYYGPNGKGSMKPCPYCAAGKVLLVNKTYPDGLVASKSGTCRVCHGTGYVFDAGNPFFKAQWHYSPHHDPAKEYVRRSRAEAALALWAAAKPTMIARYWILMPDGDDWEIWEQKYDSLGTGSMSQIFVAAGPTPEDAVSAALLAKEGVKT